VFDHRLERGGGSTLATQLVKLRHSPEGRTSTVAEKLHQMETAALGVYRNGPDTMAARRDIVVAYLNSMPLASHPGHGEVLGLGEGLANWYGDDFATANRVLRAPAKTPAELARKGAAYRHVLCLVLADRRPSYYLVAHGEALAKLADYYIPRLADAGIIDRDLAQAALAAGTPSGAPAAAPAPAEQPSGDPLVRQELQSLLGIANNYRLDRLDMSATATVNVALERQVTHFFDSLATADGLRQQGLTGANMMDAGDPSKVIYSLVLYERGADRSYLRIQADSANAPFDINSGAKLMLGSSAKLRVLVTYLDIMTDLQRRYAPRSAADLAAVAGGAADPLSRWAAQYLAHAGDRGLAGLLQAAMQRRYSASPNETFFTGGGQATFHNFASNEDGENPTVEEAFERSINLTFVRLLQDVVQYYIAQDVPNAAALLADPQSPDRREYLKRFGEREGLTYLDRFFDDYHGLAPDAILDALAGKIRPNARDLAVAFRTVRPDASADDLYDFLVQHLPKATLASVDLDRLADIKLNADGTPPANLAIGGIHPLELWVAAYLYHHPNATRAEVKKESAAARTDAYRWLLKGTDVAQQNARIRTVLEVDAFDDILQVWRGVGYPFGSLVPSLGSALGNSGDRPESLARLVGIILDNGVAESPVTFTHIRFAEGTPYETDMVPDTAKPPQVMAPEAAAVLRQSLLGVVAHGTAGPLRDAMDATHRKPLVIGGKTGTGDNRFATDEVDGQVLDSRAVDRTATFVFFLGEHYFGAITAYVPGAAADDYDFTSAYPVALLKKLAPMLDVPPMAPPAPPKEEMVASNETPTPDTPTAPPLPVADPPAADTPPNEQSLDEIIGRPTPADATGTPAQPQTTQTQTQTQTSTQAASAAPSASLSAGQWITTRGWLMQVGGNADGSYRLVVADAPRPDAPHVTVILPNPDSLPADQAQLRDAMTDARKFVTQTLLHGSEPRQRLVSLTHHPFVSLSGTLVAAGADASSTRWDISSGIRFRFLSSASTPRRVAAARQDAPDANVADSLSDGPPPQNASLDPGD
jgi:membrane peptidoglycan carboxypeptidase